MSTTAPAPTAAEGEYKKSPYAVGERIIEDIIADLSKPVPKRLLRYKTVGGQKIYFIPWHTAVKILDYRAPGWTWEITHMVHFAGRAVMTGRISIPANLNGTIWWYYRDASGTEVDEKENYGDPVSNSESMCFRRSAAKFGLGLGLYQGEQQAQESTSGNQGQSQQRSNEPPPISQKQLPYARTLAGERSMDENTVSKQLFKKELVDCNVVEAKAVIEKLLSIPIPKQQGGGDDEWDDSVF
jgi:hypothetical protein